MKKSDFLKKYIGPIVLVVGFLLLVLTISLFKSSAAKQDRKTAQNGADRYALIVQRETLTTLSYTGGASTQMDSSTAQEKMTDFLLTSEEENQKFAQKLAEYASGDSQTLKDAMHQGYSENQGAFAGMDFQEFYDALEDPSEFASILSGRFQFMAKAAQSLMDMYNNRIERLTENSGMSANEVFDLARETKTNLFTWPENFTVTIEQLGLNWKEFDYQAPGVILDWDYLGAKIDEGETDYLRNYLYSLPRENSDYFIALVDSLGSFFNAPPTSTSSSVTISTAPTTTTTATTIPLVIDTTPLWERSNTEFWDKIVIDFVRSKMSADASAHVPDHTIITIAKGTCRFLANGELDKIRNALADERDNNTFDNWVVASWTVSYGMVNYCPQFESLLLEVGDSYFALA
jgi:hypothetical protein